MNQNNSKKRITISIPGVSLKNSLPENSDTQLASMDILKLLWQLRIMRQLTKCMRTLCPRVVNRLLLLLLVLGDSEHVILQIRKEILLKLDPFT